MLSKLQKVWRNASTSSDKGHRLDFYSRGLEIFGDTYKGLGWTRQETQSLRFQLIGSLADYAHKRVLDVGCGFGDFYGFLDPAIHHPLDYVGLDEHPDILAIAQSRYPTLRFVEGSFLETPFTERFDIGLASGVFSHRFDSQMATCHAMIKKLFELSDEMCVFNLLSHHAIHRFDKTFYYYEPKDILDYCLTLTPYVQLHHHYLRHDFTLALFRG